MVRVNHLSVSLESIKKKVTRMPSKGLDVRPGEMMNTFSERNWTTRSWLFPFHIFILPRSASGFGLPSRLRKKAPSDKQKTAKTNFPLINLQELVPFLLIFIRQSRRNPRSICTVIKQANIERISILEVFSIVYGSMRWTPCTIPEDSMLNRQSGARSQSRIGWL